MAKNSRIAVAIIGQKENRQTKIPKLFLPADVVS